MNAKQQEIFKRAVNQVAVSLKRPTLYGPNEKPLSPSVFFPYSRTAAKREGSMKNWIPRKLGSRSEESMQREEIVARSIDLTQNDPHASGLVENFATTVVGTGLTPHPMLDTRILGMEKDEIRQLQAEQRAVYADWAPIADAGGRMSANSIQFLLERNVMQFGEYVILLPMMKDTTRPISLACQIIHPLRLKTPFDLISSRNIRDGVELGEYGEPIAYWIKKADFSGSQWFLPDVSNNFIRIPVKQGHRWNVLHSFVCRDPEQVRGIPFFAAAMKYMRDFNDLLDAELVSNVVTAALALFVEVNEGTNPATLAAAMASLTETDYDSDGNQLTRRYEEIIPGGIMYGNSGEKPHLLAAARPGTTFEPFTKVIKKAIASAVNLPYVIAFKDTDGANFAGFRSAMLDAWRVYMTRRSWLGHDLQKIYTMVMEEAWLRKRLTVKNFYLNMAALTRVEWRGSPKGDIEPVKAAQADILLNNARLKTKEACIVERGGTDFRSTVEQIDEEEELLEERGLSSGSGGGQSPAPATHPNGQDPDDAGEDTGDNSGEGAAEGDPNASE